MHDRSKTPLRGNSPLDSDSVHIDESGDENLNELTDFTCRYRRLYLECRVKVRERNT